jgi:hypothetical protein
MEVGPQKSESNRKNKKTYVDSRQAKDNSESAKAESLPNAWLR